MADGKVLKLPLFISWSGRQAEIIGQGFRALLPDAVNMVDLFISGSDIDKGTQWRDILSDKLDRAPCAIVCLTPESVKSVWLAFEMGAVSRASGLEGSKTRIWTYLLGLKPEDLQLLPFSQYQHTLTSEEDTFRLIKSINCLSPDEVPED